jgi:hypothetical protein
MKRLAIALFTLILPWLAWGANVAPLGLEVGVADYAAVKAKLSGQTRLKDAGINKWTQGPMLEGDGEGLDIDGLQKITFIFGQDKKLDGVIMTLDKGRLREVTAALRQKYKTVRENIPFVGDATALYRQGDSIVRIEAPHLSFSMEVLYLTDRLHEAFNKGSAAEEAERRRRQAEKF